MEKVETDDDDRPLQPITISKATIFVNPYKEMEDAEKKQEEEERIQVGQPYIPLDTTIIDLEKTNDLHTKQGHSSCAMTVWITSTREA